MRVDGRVLAVPLRVRLPAVDVRERERRRGMFRGLERRRRDPHMVWFGHEHERLGDGGSGEPL